MAVVVVVDEAGGSWSALRLAATEARWRQSPLVAVAACRADRTASAPAARPQGGACSAHRAGRPVWHLGAAGDRQSVRPAERALSCPGGTCGLRARRARLALTRGPGSMPRVTLPP